MTTWATSTQPPSSAKSQETYWQSWTLSLADSSYRGRLPKAVIFDLEDTLINSFDARRHALEKVFRLASIQAPSAHEFLTGLGGRHLFGALETLAPGLHIGETSLSEAYQDFYWSKESGLMSLFPGIRPLLLELHSSGSGLGVFTQKSRAFEIDGRRCGASNELDELGVASLFSVVVGFEDVARHKPDPEGVELALGRLGVLPKEALLVGGQCRGHRGGQSGRTSELLCHLGHTRRHRSPQHLAGLCRKIPRRAALL